MKHLTLLLFVFVSNRASAQKIFVEPFNEGLESPVIEKLMAQGIRVTALRDSSDFTIRIVKEKSAMGRASTSFLLLQTRSGEILFKSERTTSNTSAFNGYGNPVALSIKKSTEKHLDEVVSVAKKEFQMTAK